MISENFITDVVNRISPGIHLKPVLGAQCIWRSSQFSDDELIKLFAWRVTKTSNEALSEIDYKCASAEVYGGSGISNNAGGARSAVMDRFTIKGVGQTVLSGNDQSIEHNYGGLDIYSATQEIVNSRLVDAILPLGTVPIVGMIHIDKSNGIYYDGKSCDSVLLIREYSVRPASLLPISAIARRSFLKKGILNDEYRMKYIYNAINNNGGIKSFHLFMENLLHSFARQAAKSSTARLLHGALSDSNISLDGRWMDVSTAGIVPAGRNWSMQTALSQEEKFFPDVLFKLSYNFHKYTKTPINLYDLHEKFYHQLFFYSTDYSGFYFGIDSLSFYKELPQNIKIEFFKSTSKLGQIKNYEFIKRYPKTEEFDIFFLKIQEIWRLLRQFTQNQVEIRNHESYEILILLHEFQKKYGRNLIIKLIIISIKRSYLARLYAPQDIRARIQQGKTAIKCLLRDYIEKRTEQIDWIFQKSDLEKIIVLSEDGVKIVFCSRECSFIHIDVKDNSLMALELLDINWANDRCKDLALKRYLNKLNDILIAWYQ